MKEVLLVALLSVVWSLRPIGTADVVHVKTPTPAPEARADDDANGGRSPTSATATGGGDANNNDTSPCDRYLRSAEVEVRNPRNHKFVTSNGWTERQRPRPEISVYSRVEEIPSPQPPAATAAFFHRQQDSSFYQHSRQQQPAVQRTSKRIIYYATLPDVIRSPAVYPPVAAAAYPADPFAIGPGPFSADFRQLQDSSRKAVPDSFQRNRLTSYENAYNRGGSGGGGGGGGGSNGITSVTTKSTALYNSRYDEPAEFRESFYRPNELTSKYASWAEPFYKSWSSSSWDKDRSSFSNNRGSPSLSWDREPLNIGGGGSWDREPLNRGGGGSWDREPLNRGGGGSWDREPLGGDGGSPWDNRGSSWDNRGASWDKDLVEVPLQKPYKGGGGDGNNNLFNSNKYPEVTVVHSGVIDVRGDRQQNGSPHPAPPPRFTIIDVDPKPYHDRQPPTMRYDERSKPMVQQNNVRYEPPPRPMRYETYMPIQPHARFEQQQPMSPSPPSMRYEQQYRSPQQQQQPPSSTRYGQQQQSQNNQPSNGYYESIKNNINTHQFMTSWTEVSTQDEISPTHSVNLDIATVGNSTSIKNSTRIIPNTNTTKIPK